MTEDHSKKYCKKQVILLWPSFKVHRVIFHSTNTNLTSTNLHLQLVCMDMWHMLSMLIDYKKMTLNREFYEADHQNYFGFVGKSIVQI